MEKAVIVVANTRWFGETPYMEPLSSLPILSAELEGSFDYEIIDCNGRDYSEEECILQIRSANPKIALVSGLSVNSHGYYHKAIELVKKANTDIITVMGGVYATTCYDHIIEDQNVDYIILGYAEGRLSKFLFSILDGVNLQNFPGICYRDNDKVVINEVNSYIGDLEKMAIPNYSKIDLTPYVDYGYKYGEGGRELQILTSYGCPHNCLFCAVRTINGRKVAFREIEDVIEEIRYLKNEYRITGLRVADDNVLANENRAKQLFKRIIEEKFNLKIYLLTTAAWQYTDELINLMVEAGVVSVGISLESGCDRVLHEIIRKPLKKEIIPNVIQKLQRKNIWVRTSIVIGFPGETWNEIRESISFAEKCKPDLLAIFIATPLPKTDLYKLAKEQNCLTEGFDFYVNIVSSGYAKGTIETDEFTPNELEILRGYEWDRINFGTAEKRKRFCKYRGISEEQLSKLRKDARRSLGKDSGLRKLTK